MKFNVDTYDYILILYMIQKWVSAFSPKNQPDPPLDQKIIIIKYTLFKKPSFATRFQRSNLI
jgi:hypothetical protein